MYKKFSKNKLILRDQLAIDRTSLANERTLLAYVRTAIAIVAVGATILHFLTGQNSMIFGSFFIVLGVVVLLLGFARFHKVRKPIHELQNGK